MVPPFLVPTITKSGALGRIAEAVKALNNSSVINEINMIHSFSSYPISDSKIQMVYSEYFEDTGIIIILIFFEN